MLARAPDPRDDDVMMRDRAAADDPGRGSLLPLALISRWIHNEASAHLNVGLSRHHRTGLDGPWIQATVSDPTASDARRVSVTPLGRHHVIPCPCPNAQK